MFGLAKAGCRVAAHRDGHNSSRKLGACMRINAGKYLLPGAGRSPHDASSVRLAVLAPRVNHLFTMSKRPVAPPAVTSPNAADQPVQDMAPMPGSIAEAKALTPEQMAAMIHNAMVKPRQPLAFLGSQTTTNISNMCGHASFVILALAYLETDVLALRGYAASGVAFAILFQYYRAEPLWISISWNGMFLAINIAMIGLLLKDRSDAENFDEDPEHATIYEEVFDSAAMNPVDFVRLMDLAERREVKKGHMLTQEGKHQEEVFLIVEGNAEVKSRGVKVSRLQPMQFVGSMCFNRFIQASTANASPVRRISGRSPEKLASDLSGESASDDATKKGTLKRTDLVRTFSTNDQTDHGEAYEKDLHDHAVYIDDSYVPGGPGVFAGSGTPGQPKMDLFRRESIVGEVAKTLAADVRSSTRKDEAAMMDLERSLTTVTTTSDCVVYAWDMHLLRTLGRRRPSAGASLMQAIAADLNKKVDQSRGHDERYRLLLAETLRGGVITPIEKKKLQRYREAHNIASDGHHEVLQEQGWSEQDFDVGFRKDEMPGEATKNFLEYEKQVREELAKGEIKEKGRQKLRQFRSQAGIDAHMHLLAVEKQGWTADDYEAGSKSKGAKLTKLKTKAKMRSAMKMSTKHRRKTTKNRRKPTKGADDRSHRTMFMEDNPVVAAVPASTKAESAEPIPLSE